MKNVAFATLFLLLGASLPTTVKAQGSTTSAPKPQLTRAMILVPTMQTQDQANVLKADLKAAKGITYAEVELQNKKVIVAFDAGSTNLAEVNTFIQGKGYKTEILYPKQTTAVNTGNQ